MSRHSTTNAHLFVIHLALYEMANQKNISLIQNDSKWNIRLTSLTSLTLSHLTCFLLNAAVMRAFFGGLSLSQWAKRDWTCSRGSVLFQYNQYTRQITISSSLMQLGILWIFTFQKHYAQAMGLPNKVMFSPATPGHWKGARFLCASNAGSLVSKEFDWMIGISSASPNLCSQTGFLNAKKTDQLRCICQ